MPRVALAALAFAALLVSRHPQILTHANFWAEDGVLWYPDARAHGFAPLLWPVVGYLQTVSRVTALLVQPVPLRWAPTAFALIALLIQVLPPTFLVSGRLRGAWPDARTRWLAALLYVALPNAFEVYVNVTNAQWHLAVLAFLIIVADPPARWPGRVFDGAALLLACLSGPFCLLLAPIAVWQAWEKPSRASIGRLALVSVCAAIQFACFATALGGGRSAASLGASVDGLARIVALQVVVGPLLGVHSMAMVMGLPSWQSGVLPIVLTLLGAALAAYAFVAGPPVLRKFLLFAGLVMGAALLHPMVDLVRPQWPIMATPLAGGRYWFLPMLAVVGALLSLLAAPARPVRLAGWALLALMSVQASREWRVWPFGGTPDFASAARRFEASAPGTRMSLPIRPPGWTLTLVR